MFERMVLVVEDNPQMQEMWAKHIRDCTLLAARSCTEAEQFFEQHRQHIVLIVMDGCLLAGELTDDLVRKLRARFRGPMIAASGDPDHCKELVKCGCDHSVDGYKDTVPQVVKKLLAKLDGVAA